jgi:predicted amidophosphoribosyltransferase
MEMTLTIMLIESGVCPVCRKQWENDKCKCCGASMKIDKDSVTLSIPYEGSVTFKKPGCIRKSQ